MEKFCKDCKKNNIGPYCYTTKDKYTGQRDVETKLSLNKDGKCKYYELKKHKIIGLEIEAKLKLLILKFKGWLK